MYTLKNPLTVLTGCALLAASSLILGGCALDDPSEDIDELEDALEAEDVDSEFEADEDFRQLGFTFPDRNQRKLNKTLVATLQDLSCGDGPELDQVKRYQSWAPEEVGFHVQSIVYTGPFSDGSARTFYSRSDGDTEAGVNFETYEIKRNKAQASQVRADGTLDPSGGDLNKQDAMHVTGEDHVSQLEWLPALDNSGDQIGGHLFVASEDKQEVAIYYYDMDESGDPTLITGSQPLERNDGGSISQVYIINRDGYYWLAMGTKNDFEIWTAREEFLFPAPGVHSQMMPNQFDYLETITTSGGGGANCYFITDADDDVYRMCFDNDNDANCGGSNFVQVRPVTLSVGNQLDFSLGSTVYSKDLGFWGSNNALCSSVGYGMAFPTFRASGTLFVDSDGDLNIYSLAFGAKGSTFTSSGQADGRTKACSSE